jgi:MutS domain V
MIVTVLGYLQPLARKLDPLYRRRAGLRAAWGESGRASGWLASRWFDLVRESLDVQWVDDKTWEDLEFPRLFAVLNSTVSPIGGQYLYRELRRYEPDPAALRQKYQICTALRDRRDLREQLQLTLTALEAESSAEIVDVLFGAPPQRLKYHRLLSLWSACSLAVLGSSLIFSLSLWLWAPVLAINGWIVLFASPRLDRDLEGIVTCGRLLGVADRLARVDGGEHIPQVRALAAERKRRTRLRRQLGWLAMLSRRSLGADILAEYLFLTLNWCFLAKHLAFSHSVERFNRSRADWAFTLECVGSIDSSIAIANALHRYPRHCHPTVSEQTTIAITDGYHPLLERPVLNSIALHRKSAVISGSNMTGKTAFIKMVGTNIVLGRTLGVCLASNATIPSSSVMACVKSEHSLESGKSKYLAEIATILTFIERAARGGCRVFVIDELFSGTNTIERIAAAKAVLEALGARAQVLATTHDVELQHLMSPRFAHFHFREDPGVEGYFDFRLRTGASRDRNAIRLLERMGFPPEIVREALRLAENQTAAHSAAAPPRSA